MIAVSPVVANLFHVTINQNGKESSLGKGPSYLSLKQCSRRRRRCSTSWDLRFKQYRRAIDVIDYRSGQ